MKKLVTLGILMTSTLLLAGCSFSGSVKDENTSSNIEQIQSGSNTTGELNKGTGNMLKDDDKSNDDQNEKNDDKNDDQTPSKPVTTPPVTTTPGAKTYSLADVQAHASASSCWSIVNGGVYDLTSWISQHPGGQKAVLSICGKDGSDGFNGKHGGQPRPASELAGFKIGIAK